MGRKRKIEIETENDGDGAMVGDSDNIGDGDNIDDKKRKQQVTWEQEDTERLCELLLEHGKGGILNKITNAAVNEKKKQEWETVASHFNSNPKVIIFYFVCLFSLSLSLSLSLESYLPWRDCTQ